jgi:hypothetical protein
MPAVRLIHFSAGHGSRVNKLKDFEFRVWIQYLSSADDFGVLRFDARKIRADSDALGCRSERSIMSALERVVKVGLLRTFEDQGRTFLYQDDWQDYQKITFPSKTINPSVPASDLEHCTEATQLLFSFHPGGKRLPKKAVPATEELPNNFESSSEELQSPRVLLTANSKQPSADALSSEGSSRGTKTVFGPRDEWLAELVRRYPEGRKQPAYVVQGAFNDVFTKDPRPDEQVWADMLVSLECQIRGEQWAVKGMVPELQKWLTGGRCFQKPDPVKAHGTSSKTAGNAEAARRFLERREA